MMDLGLVDALSSGLRPRELVPFPEWADRNIKLERGGVQYPWQTSLTPYLRQPMLDASVDSPAEEIVIMKPSQVGASECFAVAFPMYMAAIAPCAILMVQPDLEAAAKFKQLRIDPVLRNSQSVRALFREAKSRDAGNTMHQLLFDGGSWTLVGSNSPAGLSSLPAAIVVFDERDRMAASAGVGERAEGDQYLLAKARTITFRDTLPRRKLIQISSPGETSTSKIEPAWLASDRQRWHMPCSECGALIVFSFKRLWWPRGGDPRTARYRCQVCDRLMDERAKPEQLAAGTWIAERPDREVRGYKLIGLDSPFLRWGEMAEAREKAKGNPHELRVYVNTIEGESYDTHAEAKVDVDLLKLLSTPIEWVDGKPVVPKGVGLLTGGVDAQPDRLEHTLRAWGRGEEQWHLDHAIFQGDASGRTVWDDLDVYQQAVWPKADGGTMKLAAACVDTGGPTNLQAYDYVRHKGPRRIWAVKGTGGQGKRFWPRRPNRNNKGKVDLYLLGVDAAKGQLYARLKASIEQVQRSEPPGGPGFVHIAAHLCEDEVMPDGSHRPNEYLRQLVAEYPKTVTTKAGLRIEWELPPHTRNEALDCDVYAQAALAGLKALRRSLEAAVRRENPEGVEPPTTVAAPTPTTIPDPPSEKIDHSARISVLQKRAATPPSTAPVRPRAPEKSAPVAEKKRPRWN